MPPRTAFAVLAATLAFLPAGSGHAQWWNGGAVLDASTFDKEPRTTTTLAWPTDGRLIFALPAEVTYMPAATSRIEISGPKALVDHVVIRDGRIGLEAQVIGSWPNKERPLKITATGPRLNNVGVGLGARLTGRLDEPRVKVSAATGGRAELEIRAEQLDAMAATGGAVVLRGRSARAHVNVATGASVELADLTLDDAIVRASTAGRTKLAPAKSIDASVSTNGLVDLLRCPPIVRDNVSTHGRISGCGGT